MDAVVVPPMSMHMVGGTHGERHCGAAVTDDVRGAALCHVLAVATAAEGMVKGVYNPVVNRR